MSTRKIISVGFGIASEAVEYAGIASKPSLLDWDIVLFQPNFQEIYADVRTTYQGQPSLGDTASFKFKESCEHWRREIKQAVDAGKTVIVYLTKLEHFYVDTGRREYSGTGRNRQTTRIVDGCTNFLAIPTDLGAVASSGSAMKLASKGSDFLASYWSEFSAHSKYEVLLTAQNVPACLVTRTGDKPVGAVFRSSGSAGSLLLLPDIDFYQERFLDAEEDQWTKEGEQFSARFVSAIVGLDRALRSESEITPEPTWASDESYVLPNEQSLRLGLLEAERSVEEAQRLKESMVEQLAREGRHRALLFEKGKPLEIAIIEALRVLGFQAEGFKELDSEFDVVFQCQEGRLIGEAEGKDAKAVNVDKLRQLSMNIHEDLQREDVQVPAKAVLFGNGFRLQAISERPDPFTEKCQSAAISSSTALVHTPDLFVAVQRLLASDDEEYAMACRQALLTTSGRVKFPSPGNAPTTTRRRKRLKEISPAR